MLRLLILTLIYTLQPHFFCAGQNLSKGLNFMEVFNQAKCISDSINYSNESKEKLVRKDYSGFDFANFTLCEGDIDSIDYFSGYYSETGILRKIRHYEKRERIFNFEIVPFNFQSYVIFGLNFFGDKILSEDDTGYGFIPGYFVFSKVDRQIYYINTIRKEDAFFEPIFQVFTTNDINSISLINADFYLTNIFHFQKSELKYFTAIQFDTDRITVLKERLYYYQTKFPEKLKIDESLHFEDFNYLLTKYNSEYLDVLPCLNPTNRNYPLWIHFGNHKICW